MGVYSSIAKYTRKNKIRAITGIRKLLTSMRKKKWSPYLVRGVYRRGKENKDRVHEEDDI